MKQFYYLLFMVFLFLGATPVSAQVLDPNDPVVTYNAATPPTEPQWGSVGKWVRTVRVGWTSTSYKAYIYKGLAFRLKFPKNYDPTRAKKYPVLIFFHGLGEKGTIYDNEYQLLHGGQTAMNAVDNGKFDGFLLYPQNQSGYYGATQYDLINELINNFFVPQINVDINKITCHGLSAGGTATWDFLLRFPKLVAGAGPISAAAGATANSINVFKYTPIWWFQGNDDTNPPKSVAQGVFDQAKAAGANMKLSIYPGGHGIWDVAWGEADFFPYMERAHKANPWPLTGRTEFCPGDPVALTLGLTAGFDGYEWRKDGVLIPGATGNTVNITALGTYDARIKRGSVWSEWSPIPLVIKLKGATVPPAITQASLQSKVLPAPDALNKVTLQVPNTYASYLWKKTTDGVTLSTANTLDATTPGLYTVKVQEQFGCSSDFSTPFEVIAANGPNKPDAATGLTATDLSKTSIQLNWVDKPNPAYNETGYEVYRANTPGGAYTLLAITAPNVVTYTSTGLIANTNYYYIVRAVNNTGAAANSNEATAKTQVDNIPPTAPGNLVVTASSQNQISLKWDAATDEVGINKYDIYINGLKSYTIDGTKLTFDALNLTAGQLYVFTVKARDIAGNVSPASNQTSAYASLKGLKYKLYQGDWNNLPNFATLTPVKQGIQPVVDITTIGAPEDYFGVLWEGFIRIPVAGNYTFETASDDGSKLYIGTYSHTATALVSNDALQGTTTKSGTKNFPTAGIYPIAITYFEKNGGQEMKVYWRNTANGVGSTHQLIPAEFFVESVPPTVTIAAPTNIVATAASYNKINLTWTDNSNNETGFEIYRSTSRTGTYSIVKTVGANVTTASDSALNPLTTYFYKVRAVNDLGNSGYHATVDGGLTYDYYEPSTVTSLPNFNSLTPVRSGTITTVSLSISPAPRSDRYAMKFAGYITIPTTGNYTFYTRSNDGSRLYIGGFTATDIVVENDGTRSSATEKSGTKSLTAGTYPIYVTYFENTGSSELSASWAGPGISKQAIPATRFLDTRNQAATLALPTAPAAATNVVATANSTSKITLTWNDNANNESLYQVYRSIGDNTAFLLLATLDANATAQGSFTDTALFANTKYYYKVRAKNDGGFGNYSPEANTTTLNSVPVVSPIANRSMRFGTQLSIPVTYSDADGEAVTLSTTNLPAFGSLTDNGNGTATLVFNPSATDLGTFAGIEIKATDGHSGVGTKTFTLSVNDNYPPVLNAISNVTLAENSSLQVNLSGADQNGADVISWSASGLPSFATFTPNGNTAQIQLTATYLDAGTYPVTVTINDGHDGIDTKTFNIVVSDVNPSKVVFVNFNDGSANTAGTGYWNNTNKPPFQNDVFANLKDSTLTATSISLTIMTRWQDVSGFNTSGAVTNNNSGVYPDNVMRSAYFSNAGVKQTLKVSGLTGGADVKYNFTFFGSRGSVSDNRTSIYTINGASVALNAASNTTNTVKLTNVVPDANGEVLLDINSAPGASFSYLNAMVIEASFEPQTPPSKPTNITAEAVSAGAKVGWKDVAFNETSYQVFRGTSLAGPFTQLTTPANNANTNTFTDQTTLAGTQYYFAVRAINSYGASAFSDTVGVVTTNKNPVLAAISNVSMKADSVINLALAATDDPTDVITLSATGLPAFVTLTDNGSGNGVLKITPNNSQVGTYNNVSVTASDDKGGSTTRTFTIVVQDKTLTSIFVDFNEVNPAPAPWNSFNKYPQAGASLTNLLSQDGTATGYTVTLIDQLAGSNAVGAITGSNTGVYPDVVMQTAYFEQAADAKRIRISGLQLNKKFNLVFFGSRGDVSDNRTTEYTVGAQTVTLNAAGNTQNVAKINGLSPNASGEIEFTIKRGASSPYAYINSLVIQSYEDNGLPLAPTSLKATGKSRTKITLNWMDNASTETGYEIFKSATVNGTYTLLTTVGANVTTYDDNTPPAGSSFFYKVRAAVGSVKSEYSNIAQGATYSYSTYINVNRDLPAGAPWNNTNNAPFEGDSYGPFLNDQTNNSGIGFTIVQNFSGDNPFGMNTGNNSGIYPDNVISSSWWCDIGVTAKMKFTGLNQSQNYTFVFFGSRDGAGNRTSNYTINGKYVSLNAAFNTSNTVQLENVKPDENGEVILEVSLGAGSTYAYLGSVVIHGYAATGGEPTGADAPTNLRIAEAGGLVTNDFGKAAPEVRVEKLEIVKAYPNPFASNLYVTVHNYGSTKRLFARIYDMSGKLVLNNVLGDFGNGNYNVKIDASNIQNLPAGIYVLQVLDEKNQGKSIKIIKQ
ncbi:T9SS type A sorting domain-containing protein [Chitinophaga sp. SYP-B3965]|uniref:fibronectin type III domain-containing protein n=1 Tax=Chitinophaga sp. SYP-B3965 TaxID=2663120 RepID=UPI0012999491|nr:fibronectin type III domain-containing protein [Chitinophaga sp. SYP-B3965]MRG44345.1 T9SS type A sorting domain-containing protein [Chitinophaga sp. SYP-B3965]